jgi:hypothetical protein
MIAAADFFTVEVWTRFGLLRYLVFFVMERSTRRVQVAGVHRSPDVEWTTQDFVEHDTEREDIGALVGFLAFHLLRSHVIQRPEDGAGASDRFRDVWMWWRIQG